MAKKQAWNCTGNTLIQNIMDEIKLNIAIINVNGETTCQIKDNNYETDSKTKSVNTLS